MQVLSLSLDGRSSRTSLMRSRSQHVEPQRLMTVRFDSPISERSRFAPSLIKLIYAQPHKLW